MALKAHAYYDECRKLSYALGHTSGRSLSCSCPTVNEYWVQNEGKALLYTHDST